MHVGMERLFLMLTLGTVHPIVLKRGLPRRIGKTFQRRPHVTISPLAEKDCGEAGVEVVPLRATSGYDDPVRVSPPHAI